MGWWKLRQAAKESERHETLPETLPEILPENPFIPYEILLLIAKLSDEQSIVRLIQTCHQFRRLEPMLYRHIRVPRNYGRRRQNPLQGYLLHRTLAGRPDLLPVILSYHGPLIPGGNDTESIISSGPSGGNAPWRKMWTTTRKWAMNDHDPIESAKIIFSGAVNIQELHFTDTITKSAARVFGAFGAPLGSKATNIRSLVLNVGLGSPQLAPILSRLKHLHLQSEGYIPIRLDKTALPELESLKAGLR
ncbi:hypothetical protein M407DRAFT_34697, partial [Tulasnella calospora MUT 4182]